MIANIYDSSVRMAVPLFFMVSGILFLNKKQDKLLTFFTKRATKIIVPLFAWSFIYILLKKYMANPSLDIFQELLYMLNQPVYSHLWFLYALLGVYLSIPVIQIFVQNSSKNILLYFLFLWTTTSILAPLINYFLDYTLINYSPVFTGYLGYVILGYYIDKIKLTKQLFYISIFGIVCSTVLIIIGTFYFSSQINQFESLLYDNFSILVLLQSIFWFFTLKYISINISFSEYFKMKIILLSGSVFGIYLIHLIVLKLFNKIVLNDFINNLIFSIPLLSILTFLLSFFIIIIMQKIPYLKSIVPK